MKENIEWWLDWGKNFIKIVAPVMAEILGVFILGLAFIVFVNILVQINLSI